MGEKSFSFGIYSYVCFMKRLFPIISTLLCCICVAVCSCMDVSAGDEISLVDSLNQEAYNARYKDLEYTQEMAQEAYQRASSYHRGRAEACNMLGFTAFMQMNFQLAENYFQKVHALSNNELERLIADVGMMKICQRMALNKEFYDYRNAALKRLKRLNEEKDLFVDKYHLARLNFARSDFYIVSSIYYYYLQQRQEAINSINCNLEDEEILQTDDGQYLYYLYIKGASSLCEAETVEEEPLQEFDCLFQTWRMATRNNYLYFEGNSLQGLSNLMSTRTDFEYFKNRRSYALTQLNIEIDSLLPLRLAQTALQKFTRYGDAYQIAGAYVSIGKYFNAHGEYNTAIDTLQQALKIIDKYPSIPECISRICEQLSIAFSGVNDKGQSDYYRNIYLDILEETRQDKEFESRYQTLESENNQLNIIISIIGVSFCLLLILFFLFNHYSKIRNRHHLNKLQTLLDICQQILLSTSNNAQTKDDVEKAIEAAIQKPCEDLFDKKGVTIRSGKLWFPHKPNKEEQAMARVINPYIQWRLNNEATSISLNEERERLEKKRFIHKQHIISGKRENIIKKACVAIINGIQPYIDRIINEVSKVSQKNFFDNIEIKRNKYLYIDELVDGINEYNDILALWIKLKQGSLNLSIESFPLNELFEVIRKSSRSFEMKQLHLEVTPTESYVKADKSLTLFMINTLADNARKYTPGGGKVKIYAQQQENYVEISIADNGYGLSTEDVAHLMDEKVYNSQHIGMSDENIHKEEIRKKKGSGFGLMNCKGIIEKYRKTNALFQVCSFNVESTLGKGSRFYFRLPLGAKKVITILCFLISTISLSSCDEKVEVSQIAHTRLEAFNDSLALDARIEYESLLDIASEYADNAYYSNIESDYVSTIQYIDSAIIYLNEHYKQYANNPNQYMSLYEKGDPAELTWWDAKFNSDYHIILDIRNEAAIAFLALKQWDAYTYNNIAYTTLYKLLGEDQSLEEYCKQLQRSTTNKTVAIYIVVALILLSLLGYYVLYYRKRLLYRWNLEQVLDINQAIFNATLTEHKTEPESNEEQLSDIPHQVVQAIFTPLNDLIHIDQIILAIYNETTKRLMHFSNPFIENIKEEQSLLMEECYSSQTAIDKDRSYTIPLIVNTIEGKRCSSVLYLQYKDELLGKGNQLLLELTARYIAIVLFNAVIKLASQYRDIEEAYDENHRASWEESQLHVQNLVLDNCLSTIKHETVYYPNKIKQLIVKLRSNTLNSEEERETVNTINELIEYYKAVFVTLSSCASRQLEEVTFRRTRIHVGQLMATAEKYFSKIKKKYDCLITLSIDAIDEYVVGDEILLNYLFENLLNEALSHKEDGTLSLSATRENDFIRFFFIDHRRTMTQKELNELFYPSKSRMHVNERGDLHGIEYLICKQIIREHDEFASRRGCRINAQPAQDGSLSIYFTIPYINKNQS